MVVIQDTQHQRPLPSTRYQGSKAKLVEWIGSCLRDIDFESVLDLFGGTGSVSYYFKTQGKRCIYNDLLASNTINGLALIENDHTQLTIRDVDQILTRRPGQSYKDTIAQNFEGLFYLDEENQWLDMVAQNVPTLRDKYKRALAYRALFQACIIKRPYNLFHRANLDMRTRDVERSFGNKITWDTPFAQHFMNFVEEGNAAVFSNGHRHRALCRDAFFVDAKAELVYIDTPYLSHKGNGVDYLDFYHFLEGIINYDKWPELLDNSRRHKPIRHEKPVWCDRNRIYNAFDRLFKNYSASKLIVSYRNNGIPSVNELAELLGKVKRDVRIEYSEKYSYALSKPDETREVLLIGT